MDLYFLGITLAAGLGLPIAVIGAGIGQGRAAGSAIEAMARQPEIFGRLQISMLVALAFIESLVIYALVMFFMLNAKVPTPEAAAKLLQSLPK